jgi:hypothetical protein
MRWLFVTGISLDIAGAVLVLGAILQTRPSEIAEEAVSYVGYNEARLRARVQERSYAFAGAFLLVSGFMLQLVGYAWTFSAWWMLGYAIAITVLAIFAALRSVKRLGSTFHARADELMRKAVE